MRIDTSEPTITKSFEIDGVSFREVEYPDGYDMAAHDHSTDCFVFVSLGILTGSMGAHDLCASRANLFFVPAGEMHTNQFHGKVRTFDIVPSQGFRSQFSEHFQPEAGFQIWENHPSTLVVTRMYREFQNSDSATSLILTGLMMELMGELSRTKPVLDSCSPPWLGTVMEFIHANLSNQFTLDDIGTAVGIHPAHLARVFRKHLGLTIGNYVRQLRIDQSRHLVAQTEASLADIAFGLGFTDQSHFSRSFKDEMGVSPSEYRRQTKLQTSYKRMQG